jgi:hypothetical protein
MGSSQGGTTRKLSFNDKGRNSFGRCKPTWVFAGWKSHMRLLLTTTKFSGR